jgi:hypothetical protein
MSTEGEHSTTIGDLFSEGSPPAAAPAVEAQATEPQAPAAPEAPQQPEAAPPAQEAAQQPQSHMVPLAELIDTRKRAQAAEDAARRQQAQIDQLHEQMRRLAQPQQQPRQADPIDPVSDPDAFVSHVTNLIEQRFHQQAISNSEQRAREKHGDELVEKAATEAFKQGLDVHFASRPDPHGEAIAWYQSQQLRNEIGPDPAEYRKNLEAEIRAKVLAELKQGTPPPSNLPPSLSSAARVNGSIEPLPNGRDFFNSMMNQRSR